MGAGCRLGVCAGEKGLKTILRKLGVGAVI